MNKYAHTFPLAQSIHTRLSQATNERETKKPLEMATEKYEAGFFSLYAQPFGSLVKPKAVDVHDRFALSATTANERDMNTFGAKKDENRNAHREYRQSEFSSTYTESWNRQERAYWPEPERR